MTTKTRITIISSFVLTALILPTLASAGTEIFARYLQKGDSGSDVMLLQQVQNRDTKTKIAGDDDGSTGKETDFFGELTKQAVIKLQKEHDLGSKYGFFTIYSGALDDKTREYLNKSLEGNPPVACGRKTSFLPINAASSTDPASDLNEIYRASAAVPGVTYAPFIEKVEVASKSEDKKKDAAPVFKDSKTFESGDLVKISGCNFATSTPNTITMTYNKERATSTDGTVIIFEAHSDLQKMFDEKAKDLDDDARDNVKKKMGDLPVFLTVQNDKGTSNPYQIFMKIK